MILPDRKEWALYRRVSELLLSPKEGWRRIEWNLYDKANALKDVHLPEKLSFLPVGEWAVAETQRGVTQDEVEIICQGATPWKTGIFVRGRVELFTGGWVSSCWVPKRDDAENEKNDYKTDEGKRKGKYNHFVWWNLIYKKVFFHSQVETYKENYKLLIITLVKKILFDRRYDEPLFIYSRLIGMTI